MGWHSLAMEKRRLSTLMKEHRGKSCPQRRTVAPIDSPASAKSAGPRRYWNAPQSPALAPPCFQSQELPVAHPEAGEDVDRRCSYFSRIHHEGLNEQRLVHFIGRQPCPASISKSVHSQIAEIKRLPAVVGQYN